jgi:hypothetical protein
MSFPDFCVTRFKILQTITGVGKILGLTIMLETGDIHRFAGAGNYASYCRCFDATRIKYLMMPG